MDAIFSNIQAALDALGKGSTSNAVLALVAVGTIAMAILQVVKELTPVRRMFQRQWLRRWLETRLKPLVVLPPPRGFAGEEGIISEPAIVEGMLIELSTGGDEKAFYDLATEQMVAQMNAAAQVALDYPIQHYTLLGVLTIGVGRRDTSSCIRDLSTIRDNASRMAASGTAEKPPEVSKDYLDARNRVAHRIQRNLDAVQIALGSRWKFWMQIVSIIIATLIIQAAVLNYLQSQSQMSSAAKLHTLLASVALGVVGGYLAPVTRDLVAVLQKLRRP